MVSNTVNPPAVTMAKFVEPFMIYPTFKLPLDHYYMNPMNMIYLISAERLVRGLAIAKLIKSSTVGEGVVSVRAQVFFMLCFQIRTVLFTKNM